MKWDLYVAGPARKSLKRIPEGERKRILAALEGMRQAPFSGDVARLKGQPSAWRRRVGNWRILFDIHPDKNLIVITEVLRRTSTTY